MTDTVILHMADPSPALDSARAAHQDVTFEGCDSYAALPEVISRTGAEIVYSVRFAGTPGFPRAALIDSPTVRWVSVGGSGTDHLAGWDPARVTVTNAAGVAAGMMAEYVIGGLLHFTLDLPRFRAAQARRDWVEGRVRPLAGRTLLILGLGATGRAVACKARAMGMRVLGVRARPAPTDHVDEVHGMDALPDLWPRADAVAVCVPLLDTTRGLVGPEVFAALPDGAILADVSRGGVVDQAALIAALEGGRLDGAALDVFETEPLPQDSPLWALERVMITPHCSSVYDGWEARSVEMFLDNLGRWRRGEALANVVDPVRGY
ncbi:MAG: D-2-hydroxyacid dehydrogenase [Pseudomonadota bacterium]